jgi:Family of unknown function (DUF6958)
VAVEMVRTKHPLGKSNKPVSKQSYELFKAAIVTVLQDRELTHTELVDRVTRHLSGKFDGNISWHTMTVKLDLEARRVIERTSSRPQRYRLT